MPQVMYAQKYLPMNLVI